MIAIESKRLTKTYGSKTGCRDVTLCVRRGEVFGFLGPNGAGKSTFVKMLVGLLFPTSGEAYILGKPVGDVNIRRSIGYLPENFRYQKWMTGEELLSFHATLYKMDKSIADSRIEEVLSLVKLKAYKKKKIGTYSKGMQQRLGIASALLANPRVLFLDEPTSALDPVGRKEVRDIVIELKNQGKTVFLNSHLLSEIEMICDSVAIINSGSIVKKGSMGEILERDITLEISAEGVTSEVLDKLRNIDNNAIKKLNKVTMKVQSKNEIPNIANLLIENGCRLYELTPRRKSLEDMFIDLVGEGEVR